MKRIAVVMAGVLLAMLFAVAGWAQQPSDVDGRVFDQANGRGLENLEVKLTPPTRENLPVRLASTDPNGQFRFSGLRATRYLVEVSQGANLLYRAEVDAATQRHLDIPLQKR